MSEMTESYQDFSFVVQGRVESITRETIVSIKTFFPEAQIIFSTWEGEVTGSLASDKVIYNRDPGSLPIMAGNVEVRQENTNRQIVSTVAGLKAVTTPYAVKVRQDLVFTNDRLLRRFQSLQKSEKPGPHSPFKSKILVSTYNTQNPKSFLGFKNQLSDWFMVGNTRDLLNYWDGPLINWSEAEFDDNKWPDRSFKNGFQFGKFSAEQHLFNRWLAKRNIATPKYFRDPEYFLTDTLFDESFSFISPLQAGIDNAKYRKLIRPTFSLKGIVAYLFTWSVLVEGYENKRLSIFGMNIPTAPMRSLFAFLYRKIVYKI